MKFSSLYLFIFLTLIASCNQDNPVPIPEPESEEEPPITNIPDGRNLVKYLALGDSYTIGQSVAINDRFPIQLEKKLVADSIPIDTTIIIARTGWRTDNLMTAINEANLTDTFELVSLLIGVNNQYQNGSISIYEEQFAELLQTAIELAGGDKDKVFVVSIPDYGYTPFGIDDQPTISEEIDMFNNVNEEITKAENISWFDITPISRQGLADPDLVADDELHPSGKMYKEWVESFYEAVKNKME